MSSMNDNYSKYFPENRELNPLQPKEHDCLVRFLSLTKIIHLLETQTLHFQRLDKFEDEDRDEGAWTAPDVTGWKFHGQFDVEKFSNNFRITTAITCWSKISGKLDTAKMWQKYICKNQGLAIVTIVSILCEQVKNGLIKMGADFADRVIAEVRYINRDTHSNLVSMKPSGFLPNAFLPYFQKSDHFSFEEEVRLLLFAGLYNGEQMLVEQKGVDVPIHINELIKEIWLPPNMPQWERGIISNFLKKYDLRGKMV